MEDIKKQIENDLKKVSNIQSLNELKVTYLGKKGVITELNSKIRDLPNEEKREYGQKVGEIRTYFQVEYDKKRCEFEKEELNKRLEKEKIDVTLPGKKIKRGSNWLAKAKATEVVCLDGSIVVNPYH